MPDHKPIFLKEVKETLFLAVPIVLAQLAQISMGFVDTVMVGRLGSEELAGVALGNSVFFFFVILCMGVILAVGPMVSQAFGAGEEAPIERSVRQGLWLGFMMTLPAFVLLWNMEPILLLLGQEDATAARAAAYLRAILWGFLPLLWFVALRSFAEGLSRPLPVTIITFFGVALNISANYVLMYGKLGFPALGIVGTGWASTIVYWFLFLALTLYIHILPFFRGYHIFAHIGKPDWEYFRELFRIGWPIGVSLGIESGLFTTTALLVGLFGSFTLAAHQVALQSAGFTFMVPLGVSIAASIRVGHAVGRNDASGVRWAGWVGILIAAVFMLGTATVFWTVPKSVVSLYLDLSSPDNIEVVPIAVSLLVIAAIFQLFDGVQVAAAGALRGLKDTRKPMLIGLISYWMIGLTSGLILSFIVGMEAQGLWWGLVLGLGSAAILLSRRFLGLTQHIERYGSLDESETISIVQ